MKLLPLLLLISLPAIPLRAEETPEFAAAMDFYQARKWSEARAKFTEAGNLAGAGSEAATLAAFYAMECLRRSGDLAGLAAASREFNKDGLPCGHQRRQIELHALWEAVRTEDWQGVLALAGAWEEIRLPGDQRAQVAWCRGLALEGLKRPEEALFSYQTALTADAGASVEIARSAALRILAILQADPEVTAALKARGTAGENQNSKGYLKLREAAGVARLFQLGLGGGAPLPPAYQEFLTPKPGAGAGG